MYQFHAEALAFWRPFRPLHFVQLIMAKVCSQRGVVLVCLIFTVLIFRVDSQFALRRDFTPFPSYFSIEPRLPASAQAVQLYTFLFSETNSSLSAEFNLTALNFTAAMVLCPHSLAFADLLRQPCNPVYWRSIGCLEGLYASTSADAVLAADTSQRLTIPDSLLPFQAALFVVRCDAAHDRQMTWNSSLAFFDGHHQLDRTQAPFPVVYTVLTVFSLTLTILVCLFMRKDLDSLFKTSIVVFFVVYSLSLLSSTLAWFLISAENSFPLSAFSALALWPTFIRSVLALFVCLLLAATLIFWVPCFDSVSNLTFSTCALMPLLIDLTQVLGPLFYWTLGSAGQSWTRWFDLAGTAALLGVYLSIYLYLVFQNHWRDMNFEMVQSRILTNTPARLQSLLSFAQPEVQSGDHSVPSEKDGETVHERTESFSTPSTAAHCWWLAILFGYVVIPSLWNFLLPVLAPEFTWRYNWVEPLLSQTLVLGMAFSWVAITFCDFGAYSCMKQSIDSIAEVEQPFLEG